MRRRDFIAGLGATALPLTARAQQGPVPIVAFLGLAPASGYASRLDGMRSGLREFGFIEGKNFVFEFRWADNPGQLHELAAELARLNPAIIVPSGNAAAVAAKSKAPAIPMVFSIADDPVRLGLVASFSHPGGNATGTSLISGAIGAKRIALLREFKPDANLIAMLINPNNPAEANQRDDRAQAQQVGQKLLVLPAVNEREIEAAFAQAAQNKAGALLVTPDAFFTAGRGQIIGLAARYKLPAMYAWREFAEDGGLMSYGVNLGDAYRQSGIYIGRILRGVKPADLPVSQPTKIELTINLNTAKSLGLEVPVKLLALADAVIE